MDYFLDHIGVIFGASLAVAGVAVGWWYLLEKNAELKRQRAEARKKEAIRKRAAEKQSRE